MHHKDEVQEVRDQYEKMLDHLRKKNSGFMLQKEREMIAIAEKLTNTQITSDRLANENDSMKTDLLKYNKALKDDIYHNDDRIATLEQEATDLQQKVLTRDKEVSELHSTYRFDIKTMEQTNHEQSKIMEELNSKLQSEQTKKNQISDEVISLRRKVKNVSEERDSDLNEITKIKSFYENEHELYKEDYNFKLQDLEI